MIKARIIVMLFVGVRALGFQIEVVVEVVLVAGRRRLDHAVVVARLLHLVCLVLVAQQAAVAASPGFGGVVGWGIAGSSAPLCTFWAAVRVLWRGVEVMLVL
jgi:hypothetical protein